MHNKLNNPVVQAIAGYIIFSSIILLITKIWYPALFQDTLIVAFIAPIILTMLAIPIYLILLIWLKLSTRNDEMPDNTHSSKQDKVD